MMSCGILGMIATSVSTEVGSFTPEVFESIRRGGRGRDESRFLFGARAAITSQKPDIPGLKLNGYQSL